VFSELTVGKVNEHVSELHDWLAPLKRIGPTFLSDAPMVAELVSQICQYSDEVADMPKGLVTVLRVLHYITIAPPTSDIGRELVTLLFICLFSLTISETISLNHRLQRWEIVHSYRPVSKGRGKPRSLQRRVVMLKNVWFKFST